MPEYLPFDVHYTTDEGTFSFWLYATSLLHAELLLEDIKKSAHVVGQIIETTK